MVTLNLIINWISAHQKNTLWQGSSESVQYFYVGTATR
jgi:hypothetical protein